jgi:hypothetical protein
MVPMPIVLSCMTARCQNVGGGYMWHNIGRIDGCWLLVVGLMAVKMFRYRLIENTHRGKEEAKKRQKPHMVVRRYVSLCTVYRKRQPFQIIVTSLAQIFIHFLILEHESKLPSNHAIESITCKNKNKKHPAILLTSIAS